MPRWDIDAAVELPKLLLARARTLRDLGGEGAAPLLRLSREDSSVSVPQMYVFYMWAVLNWLRCVCKRGVL